MKERQPDNDRRRSKSISVKVTEDEYRQLFALAAGRPCEWARGVVLTQLTRPPVDEVVVAEMLALRAIVLTSLSAFAPKVDVAEIARFADGGKVERARKALAAGRDR